MKKTEILYKDLAMVDIASGMTCEELMHKYPISMYYARKWSGEVYRNADMDHLVRDRYKYLVIAATNDIENVLSENMAEDDDISEETWDAWVGFIRRRLYDLTKEVIKKN